MKKTLFGVLMALCAIFTASAADVYYSYVPDGATPVCIGGDQATWYQVVMRVNDANLSSTTLTAVNFKLNVKPEDVESCQVWLTRRLTASPSLTNQCDATIDENGNATAVLTSPFKLTGANIYVGYTLQLKQAVDNPIVVADVPAEYGLFMRTSSTGAFEQSETQSAYIDVVFNATKFQELGASWGTLSEVVVGVDEPTVLNTTIVNRGSTAIESIEYSYTFGENSGTGTKTFDPAISYKFGDWADISIDVPAESVAGTYQGELLITKVNGIDVTNSPSTFKYIVVPYFPANRPLFEEYTGTLCGNCPRGMAALEAMHDKYGDRFIAVAYHNYTSDPMQVLLSVPVSGYPNAQINRRLTLDPYFGVDLTKPVALASENYWLEFADEFTPAGLKVKAEWVDEAQTQIQVTSETTFVTDPGTSPYRVGYILLQNHLTAPADQIDPATGKIYDDSSWAQSNYYSVEGQTVDGRPAVPYDSPYWGMPYMDQYIEMPAHITGPDFSYDHVCILMPSWAGEDNSVVDPQVLEPNYHSIYMHLSEANSYYGQSLVRDKKDLRVVAFLYSGAKAAIINAAECEINGEYSAVSELDADQSAEVVATEWYDLAGTRVAAPASKGLFIRVDRLANGKRVARKVAL